MDIQKIAHAQQNWEVPVNQNFANLTADTGWISLPVLAPFTGTVMVRKYGNLLEINGSIARLETVITSGEGALISTIPVNLLRTGVPGLGIIAYTGITAAYSRLTINTTIGSIQFYDSNTDRLESTIRFDTTIIC